MDSLVTTRDLGYATDVLSWASVCDIPRRIGIDHLWASQYFECRLGSPDQQVDYLCAFSRSAATALHRKLHAFAQCSHPGGESWIPVERLLGMWVDRSSLTSQVVSTMWLEFDDVCRPGVGCPTPSVSICLVNGYRHDRSLDARPKEGEAVARELLDAIDADRAAIRAIADCFECADRYVDWIHLSVMIGRKPQAVKLYGTMSRERLLPFLRRVRWSGDERAIEEALATLYPPDLVGEELFVDLNLDNFRVPERCSLGLAVGQQHVVRGPHTDPARASMLDRWTTAGLCAPEKADAVRRWVERAPESAAEYDRLMADRFIDLKLVWQAGGRFQAKAYLGGHRPYSRS